MPDKRFHALVFDMDGVILLSNEIKHQALLRLFEDHSGHLDRISAYNRSAGGVPRAQKFRHIWERILGREYSPQTEEVLSARYVALLGKGLLEAPLMEGIESFLSGNDLPKYVCSAAPQEEVELQIRHHRLRYHFAHLYGAPVAKCEALADIIARVGCEPRQVLFFGDALADLEAAEAAGTTFVGVVRERNNFGNVRCPTLTDFQNALLIGRPQAA